MSKDKDYQELLDATVDEVKDEIDNLEDPDYEALLDAEKEGEDRESVKDYITDLMDDEDLDDEDEEEIVEEIEEETRGGLLGSFSREKVLAGGLILGLLLGFILAGLTGVTSQEANPDEVRESVNDLLTAGDFQGEVEISEPEVQNGLYFMNVEVTQQLENETVTNEQGIYVTLDGELLFPVQEQMGQRLSPINIEESIEQARQAAQMEDQVGDVDAEELEDLEDELDEEIEVEVE